MIVKLIKISLATVIVLAIFISMAKLADAHEPVTADPVSAFLQGFKAVDQIMTNEVTRERQRQEIEFAREDRQRSTTTNRLSARTNKLIETNRLIQKQINRLNQSNNNDIILTTNPYTNDITVTTYSGENIGLYTNNPLTDDGTYTTDDGKTYDFTSNPFTKDVTVFGSD